MAATLIDQSGGNLRNCREMTHWLRCNPAHYTREPWDARLHRGCWSGQHSSQSLVYCSQRWLTTRGCECHRRRDGSTAHRMPRTRPLSTSGGTASARVTRFFTRLPDSRRSIGFPSRR